MSSSSLFSTLGAALQNFSSPRFSFKASSPTSRSNPGLEAFEAELATQLEQLKSTDEGDYLSITWLCQAMEVVLSTHASVEAFVPDLQQALADGDFKWLDEYLDDSVKLLDICRALRDAITEIKNYHVYVELALHTLAKGSLGDAQLRRSKNALLKCMDALKRKDDEVNHLGQRRSKLENCSSMLRRMGEKLNMEDASKGNFFMVIYAAQVSTIFICGVLTSALSFKPRRPLSTISVGGQSAWSFSLTSLQHRAKEQIEKKKVKGANALLEELDRTDVAVCALHDKVEKLLNAKCFPLGKDKVIGIKQAVSALKDCSDELFQGLAPLEVHVADVFKVLIASRVALLDIYSHA
ncbi:hypothetical protein L7F22_066061 [Adiantum nelumboides]|nr:hypothetical protein [Adiantum nelumboides]